MKFVGRDIRVVGVNRSRYGAIRAIRRDLENIYDEDLTPYTERLLNAAIERYMSENEGDIYPRRDRRDIRDYEDEITVGDITYVIERSELGG